MWLSRGEVLSDRRAATACRPSCRRVHERDPVSARQPQSSLAASLERGRSFTSPISQRSRNTLPRSARRSSSSSTWRRAYLCCADAQGEQLIGAIASIARRCAPSPTSRSSWSELRRPGRHRHREHPAAQRAAPAHGRSERGAGAADRDLGGAAGHLQLARRAGAGVPGHAGERDADLRGQVRHLYLLRRRLFTSRHSWRATGARRASLGRRGPAFRRPRNGPSPLMADTKQSSTSADDPPTRAHHAAVGAARRRSDRISRCRCSRTTS